MHRRKHRITPKPDFSQRLANACDHCLAERFHCTDKLSNLTHMKNIFFALAGALLLTFSATAQESGDKLAKQARKALVSYNIDPANNKDKLDEAKQKIDAALALPDAQAMASAWITKGDIYNTILQKDMGMRALNPKAPLSGDNDALVAFEAFQKGYELTTKKFEKSDAIKGIGEVQGHLINIGNEKYEKQEYEKSFLSYKASLAAHELLKANTQKSFLDDPATLDDQTLYTGLIAQLANRPNDALPFFEQLYKKGNAKAQVYEGLYTIKSAAGDEAGAFAILQEGRQKHPDDTGLLFNEINYYLKQNKLDELTSRLKSAIDKEPGNIGLYVTLGNVYDNLYQIAQKEKNEAKATEYYESAKKYYTDAMGRDPKNAEAAYAMGALYYNQAALLTQEMNAMPEDYSSAGLKKLEAINKKVMEYFDKSLPFFQKAESLNPNDMNTLIALSEIYARKEDADMITEFKKRFEVVKGGGKNASAYFKQ